MKDIVQAVFSSVFVPSKEVVVVVFSLQNQPFLPICNSQPLLPPSVRLPTISGWPPTEGAETWTAEVHLLWAAAGDKFSKNSLWKKFWWLSIFSLFALFTLFTLFAGLGGVSVFGCCLTCSWLCHFPDIQVIQIHFVENTSMWVSKVFFTNPSKNSGTDDQGQL